MLSITRATQDDALALVKLQIDAFHYDSVLYPEIPLGGPDGYDSVSVMQAKIVGDDVYTIHWNGQLVGGIVVFVQADDHYHLDLIFLDPAVQNQGIGTQALTWLWAQYPAQKWTLDTPSYAIRNQHFYEKMGFVRVGTFEDDGLTLIAYERVTE